MFAPARRVKKKKMLNVSYECRSAYLNTFPAKKSIDNCNLSTAISCDYPMTPFKQAQLVGCYAQQAHRIPLENFQNPTEEVRKMRLDS